MKKVNNSVSKQKNHQQLKQHLISLIDEVEKP